MRRAFVIAGWIACASTASTEEPPARMNGITLSTHRGGLDWGSDALPEELVEMSALGANWIAIHPYARIGEDGSVTTRYRGATAPEHIARPIREAKLAGMKILIKPHLAYWGSPFSWRGAIDFEEDAHWERFWKDYQAFILDLAKWSRAADGFVVGTELRKIEGQEDRWRALIELTRGVTDVPLSYASNWDDFERIEFWDALDWIGIQAYFPLTESSDTGAGIDRDALERGWSRWMAKLRAYSMAHDRPIVFTELGYNQSYSAPSTPWDYRTDDDGAKAVQELCLTIALEAIAAEPSVLGAFLWKWFLPPRRVGRNFQLATPEMKAVIQKSWRTSQTAPR